MEEDFVAWDEAYSVGFEPLDNQHKKLVTMVNALFAGCKMGNVAADLVYKWTINDALEYAGTHFSDEEKYMSQVDYPKLDEHKKQHEEFVVEINKSVELLEKGKKEPVELVKFLKNWLLNHIAVSDKQYAPYLAKLAKSD
jgi:hemerythrin